MIRGWSQTALVEQDEWGDLDGEGMRRDCHRRSVATEKETTEK
jgi:hypothetical protein